MPDALKALAELEEKVKGILPLQADDETFGKILTKSGEYVCECADILEGDGEEYEPDKDGWTRNSGCDVAAYLALAANSVPGLLAERAKRLAVVEAVCCGNDPEMAAICWDAVAAQVPLVLERSHIAHLSEDHARAIAAALRALEERSHDRNRR